jgi:cytosine/adenosine deaminase-related metal-dependent hydrolase
LKTRRRCDKGLKRRGLPSAVPVYSGPIWRAGESSHGSVRIERGRVVEQTATERASAHPSVILDGVHDHHTHLGDAFLRGRPLPRSLERLVRPPTGYKHQMLARASRATIEAGIRRALTEYAAAGTQSLIDFREQGVSGVRLLRSAHHSVASKAPRVLVLGRPMTPDEDLEPLLGVADGIGLSSLHDVEADRVAECARACRRAHRLFALHASEARREDMATILANHPDLLVHLVKATPQDLRRIADADVPVVLCPRSNAFFRLRSPVAAVHQAGIRFHFGTDNAMLGNRDLVDEARRARRLAPKVPDDALLRALTTSPEKAIKRAAGLSTSATTSAQRILVLPRRGTKVRWDAKAIAATR